jgi:hypothetical protein
MPGEYCPRRFLIEDIMEKPPIKDALVEADVDYGTRGHRRWTLTSKERVRNKVMTLHFKK